MYAVLFALVEFSKSFSDIEDVIKAGEIKEPLSSTGVDDSDGTALLPLMSRRESTRPQDIALISGLRRARNQ